MTPMALCTAKGSCAAAQPDVLTIVLTGASIIYVHKCNIMQMRVSNHCISIGGKYLGENIHFVFNHSLTPTIIIYLATLSRVPCSTQVMFPTYFITVLPNTSRPTTHLMWNIIVCRRVGHLRNSSKFVHVHTM